jgi:RNA:NAD 2'-phosphotransferase (TPT1/KptA family)
MTKPKYVRQMDDLTKNLHYALGVAPGEFALCPGPDGYAPIKEVVAALRGEDGFRGLTENRVREVVGQALGQTPLEIEGSLIRVKPELANLPTPQPAAEPKPKLLYVGLKPTFWPVALTHGLKPKPGQDRVRLYPTEELAKTVAQRWIPEPVMVAVNKAKAEKTGTKFEIYAETIYLATEITAEALFGPPIEPRAPEKAPPPRTLADPIPHHGKIRGKRDDAPDWKNQARQDRRRK